MNEDAFCGILQNHEKKNPVAKCYPQWVLNSGPLTFMLCMLLSEVISGVIPNLPEVRDLYILLCSIDFKKFLKSKNQ